MIFDWFDWYTCNLHIMIFNRECDFSLVSLFSLVYMQHATYLVLRVFFGCSLFGRYIMLFGRYVTLFGRYITLSFFARCITFSLVTFMTLYITFCRSITFCRLSTDSKSIRNTKSHNTIITFGYNMLMHTK